MKRTFLIASLVMVLAGSVFAQQGSIARGYTYNAFATFQSLPNGSSFRFEPGFKGRVALKLHGARNAAVFDLDSTTRIATLKLVDDGGLFQEGVPPMSVYFEPAPSVNAFTVTNATGEHQVLGSFL